MDLTTRLTCAAVCAALILASGAAAQTPAPAERFVTLEELERLALDNNPTLAQADAIARSVVGRRQQVSRYPNPVVGYSADDVTARQPGRSKHFVWAQQTFITGGKRDHVHAALAQEEVHAALEKDMQRQRVLNAVRMLYWEALGAARLVEIRRDLVRVARDAVETSEELFNIGQADRPDVLAVLIEAERTGLELGRAEQDLARVWQELAAMVGEPNLPLTPLAGDLEADVPALDEDAVRRRIVEDGPELKIARARLEHARASLARARADRIPNVFVRGSAGYNFERFAPGKDVGPEFGLEIGLPLPIFDHNEGNIAAAEAQQRLAAAEVRRTELTLRTRAAGALRGYRDALRTVERYRAAVLAQAQRSHQLYLQRFREMAAAYPQVLITQRNLGQVRAEYVRALVDARQHAVLLDGLLLTGGLEAPGAVPGEPPVTIEAVPFTTTP